MSCKTSCKCQVSLVMLQFYQKSYMTLCKEITQNLALPQCGSKYNTWAGSTACRRKSFSTHLSSPYALPFRGISWGIVIIGMEMEGIALSMFLSCNE